MKNSFKFGFLALAMTVAFASCGGSQTKTEDAAEEVSTTEVEVDNTAETLENAVDSTATAVAAEESLENVQ